MSVKVGVIGAGEWGADLIQELQDLRGCSVDLICDHNSSRLIAMQGRFPHVPVTSNCSNVLQNESLDAVVIATPADSHYQLVQAALQAGKHVMVRAPLVLTGSEAEALVAAAVARDKILMGGHDAAYHPAVTEMKSMLAFKEIGDWCYMESSHMSAGIAGAKISVLWDLGIQEAAIALYLAGEQPVVVSATGRDFLRPGLIDVAFLTITYASGRFSQHHVSWLSPHMVRRFFVAGRENAVFFSDNRHTDKLRLYRLGAVNEAESLELAYGLDDIVIPAIDRASSLGRQCADFIAAISNGHLSTTNGPNGRDIVKVLAAADRSIREGSIPVGIVD